LAYGTSLVSFSGKKGNKTQILARGCRRRDLLPRPRGRAPKTASSAVDPSPPAGPVEKFILDSSPKIRDPKRPWESMASLIADVTLSQLFGTTRDN